MANCKCTLNPGTDLLSALEILAMGSVGQTAKIHISIYSFTVIDMKA